MKEKTNFILVATSLLNTAILFIALFGSGMFAFDLFKSNKASRKNLDAIVTNMEGGTILSAYTEPEESNTVTIVEVESAMSQIGEITTVAYEYEGVAIETDCDKFICWDMEFTKNSVEVDYEGVIRAGYVIADITVDINQDDKVIYITLPKAKVFSNEITDYEVICDNNWLNHIDPNTATDLIDEVKDDELDAAIDQGLYKDAETNAKTVIKDVLSEFSGYQIVFK